MSSDGIYTWSNAPDILFDIIDEAWSKDYILPSNSIYMRNIPITMEIEEEEQIKEQIREEDDRWTDLGINGFSSFQDKVNSRVSHINSPLFQQLLSCFSAKRSVKFNSYRYLIFNSKTQSFKMPIDLDEDSWRKKLDPQVFKVLRQRDTELPYTGIFNKFYEDGEYLCAGCDTKLFKSDSKFDSGSGWPSFFDSVPHALSELPDESSGRVRIEIVCSNCGGHIGHVFRGEGNNQPIDQRYCANSLALKFKGK